MKPSVIGNVGRGADAARYTLALWVSGIIWTTVLAFAVSAAIFSILFVNTTSSRDRTIVVCYVSATATSLMNDDYTVPGFLCPSQKTARQILTDIEASPSAMKTLRITEIKAASASGIAIIPGAITFVLLYFMFLLIGVFQAEDEHIRGAKLFKHEIDSNEYLALKIKKERLVERWFVKRLRSMY